MKFLKRTVDLTSKWRTKGMLYWERCFMLMPTGKERLWIPFKLIKIRLDRGSHSEDLGYIQKETNQDQDR